MSVITGLKTIDKQKYAVVTLLDAFGVDIDPEDGHIFYSADPAICLKINDKVLRVDVGKMRKDVAYTNYNPLYREDHAQFLMTIAIYAEVIDDFLDPDEAKADDFEIYSELVFPSTGEETMIPHTLTKVTRQYGNKECGQGFHKEPAIATVMAVLDFANQLGYVTGETFKHIRDVIDEAYAEYVEMADMKASQRRRDLKAKNALLQPEIEDDDQVFYDEDINPEREPEKPLFFENDETWNNPPMTESDFIQNPEQDFMKEDIDWRTTEFTKEELEEFFGIRVTDNDSIVEEPEMSEIQNVNLTDISDIGYIPPVQNEPQNLYEPFGGCPQYGGIGVGPAMTMLPQTETPMPDIKLEDIVSSEDLEKIQKREDAEKPKVEDFINGTTYDTNPLVGFGGYGNYGMPYIPQ